MRFMQWAKDGGPESTVDAFFILEIKRLFSIVILKFNDGTREKFHDHAFDALTWFIRGDLEEEYPLLSKPNKKYKASIIPKYTKKSLLHRVRSRGVSWCFSIRGPWEDYWSEYDNETKKFTTLTHGRKKVD